MKNYLCILYLCRSVLAELETPTSVRTIAPVVDDVPMLPGMARTGTKIGRGEQRMMQDPRTGVWRMVAEEEGQQTTSRPHLTVKRPPIANEADPPSIGDEVGVMAQQVVSGLIPGASGELSATVLKRMAQGIERRRSRAMAQDGIKYDAAVANYRTPIGLPCDPRKHPLLCTLEDETTTTTRRVRNRPRKGRNQGS